jgi:hypothetical protein
MAKKPAAVNYKKENKKKLRVKRKAVGLEQVGASPRRRWRRCPCRDGISRWRFAQHAARRHTHLRAGNPTPAQKHKLQKKLQGGVRTKKNQRKVRTARL